MGDCPYIAFGLRCLAAAMKAKSGKITRPETRKLVAEYYDFRLSDDAAFSAVTAFADIADHDPTGAGNDLHDFLLSWRDAAIADQARQIAEILPEQDPTWPNPAAKIETPPKPAPAAERQQPRFDWQDRADING